MAILTKYTKKDLDGLLEHYKIGRYKSHKHVDFALENTVYILSTTKGKYVLKIFEFLKLKSIRYQLRAEEYLYSKGVKIPKVVLTKDGKDLLIYKKKPVSITEFVKGKHVKRLSNELVKDLGKSVGKMHKVLLKSKIRNMKNWPLAENVIQKHRQIFNAPKGYMQKEYKELLKELKTIDCSKLRKSIIHGDLHPINFLVENNKVKAFLDWGDVHKNYISYDLAVLFASAMLGMNGFKKDKLKSFMKEYEKEVKLLAEEKKSIMPFIKVRLMSANFWRKNQMRTHKEHKKHLEKGINYDTRKYELIDRMSLDKFLDMF